MIARDRGRRRRNPLYRARDAARSPEADVPRRARARSSPTMLGRDGDAARLRRALPRRAGRRTTSCSRYYRELHERGVRLRDAAPTTCASGSRTGAPMLPIDEIFEMVVDSAFVGVRKPDPRDLRDRARAPRAARRRVRVRRRPRASTCDAARELGFAGGALRGHGHRRSPSSTPCWPRADSSRHRRRAADTGA